MVHDHTEAKISINITILTITSASKNNEKIEKLFVTSSNTTFSTELSINFYTI